MSRTLRFAMAVCLGGFALSPAARAEPPEGSWNGTYTCYQGQTALDLVLFRDAKHRLRADFHFSAVPSNPGVPEGCFTMNGSFEPQTGAVDLRPGRWLLRPFAYVMIGLHGTLSADGSAIEGVISPAVPGCTTFTLRSVAASPAAPAACHSGSLSAALNGPSAQ